MGEKARFILCQQKGVNEHLEPVFDELLDQNTTSTRDFGQVLKAESHLLAFSITQLCYFSSILSTLSLFLLK